MWQKLEASKNDIDLNPVGFYPTIRSQLSRMRIAKKFPPVDVPSHVDEVASIKGLVIRACDIIKFR
jgi:hypothetical protein